MKEATVAADLASEFNGQCTSNSTNLQFISFVIMAVCASFGKHPWLKFEQVAKTKTKREDEKAR